MKLVPLRRQTNPPHDHAAATFTDLAYPFQELGTLISHLHPRFVIVSSGDKWTRQSALFNPDTLAKYQSAQMLMAVYYKWTSRRRFPKEQSPLQPEDDHGSDISQEDSMCHTPPRRLRITSIKYQAEDDEGSEISQDNSVHTPPRRLRPLRGANIKHQADSRFPLQPEENDGSDVSESDSMHTPPTQHRRGHGTSIKRQAASPARGSPRPHQRVRVDSDTISARLDDEVLKELGQALLREENREVLISHWAAGVDPDNGGVENLDTGIDCNSVGE